MVFSTFTRTTSGVYIIFSNSTPLEWVKSLKFYRDNTVGTFTKKEFRWSFDDNYWSAWETLNQGNISGISINCNRYLFLEIRYTPATSATVTTFSVDYLQTSSSERTVCSSTASASATTTVIPTDYTSTSLGTASIINSTLLDGNDAGYYLWRPNQTGQQPIATIIDLQKTLNNLAGGIWNSINNGANATGDGIGVYYEKDGQILYFKRIVGGNGVSVSDASGIITLDVDASVIIQDPSIDDLYDTKLDNSTDTFSGILTIDGSLTVSNSVGIGTTDPSSILHINGGVGSVSTGLTFGDGDTGIYEYTDDTLYIKISGNDRWRIENNVLGSVTSGPALLNYTATSTIPSIVPGRTNSNTGLGRAAEDYLSLIGGGKEVARIDGSGNTRKLIVNPDGSIGSDTGLWFGDGDTGIYESSDDTLRIDTGGGSRYDIISSGIYPLNTTNSFYLRRTVPTSTNPTYSFVGDADTGIGRAAANQISLIGGGKEIARLEGDSTSRKVIVNPDGSIGTDTGLYFVDSDTGIYKETAARLVFITEGVTRATIKSDGLMGGANANNHAILRISTATSTDPAFSFTGDYDTGLGKAAADQLSLISGAKEIARLEGDSSSMKLRINPDGSVGTDTGIWFGDGDTGIYEESDDILKIYVGDYERWQITGSILGAAVGSGAAISRAVGSATSPNIFSSLQDQDTGIGRAAANQLSLIGGGKEIARLEGDSTSRKVILNPDGSVGLDTGIWFGDGDTGIYELVNDYLTIRIGGSNKAYFEGNNFRGTNNSGRSFNINVTGLNGTITPAYSFNVDTDTGIGHIADDQLSLISGAKEIIRLDGSINKRKVIVNPDGSVGADTGLWFGDGDTGFYEYTDDYLILRVGGVGWDFSTTYFGAAATNKPILRHEAATSTNPNIIPRYPDNDTGIGAYDLDYLSLIGGGKEIVRIDGSGNTRKVTVNPDGSVGTDTGLYFGDGDTGFYESVDDRLKIKIEGTDRFQFLDDGFTTQYGSAALFNEAPSSTNPVIGPSYSDTDTGIGQSAPDQLSLIGGGVEMMKVDGSNREVTIGGGDGISDLTINGYDTTPSFTIRDSGNDGWQMQVVNDDFRILTVGGGFGYTLTLDYTDGYVGINTYTPLSALHIDTSPGALTSGLTFGDGDSGFYESEDDRIVIELASQTRWEFHSDAFRSTTTGPELSRIGSSTTSASVRPQGDDNDTGLNTAAPDQLSLIAGGKEVARIDGSANARKIILNSDGSYGLDTGIWFGDGDTGFYEFSDDNFAFRLGDATKIYFSSNYMRGASGDRFDIEYLQTASSTIPIYTFRGDTDTGINRESADQLSLISGGKEVIRLDGSINKRKVIVNPDGSLGTDTGLWFGDGDTGIYELWDDGLVFRSGGVNTAHISGDTLSGGGGAGGRWSLKAVDATDTIPVFTFISDDDTGIGSEGADQLSLISGGKEIARLDGSINKRKFIINPDGSYGTDRGLYFGDADTGFYENADDSLLVLIGNDYRWQYSSDYFRGSDSYSPQLYRVAGSTTIPVYTFRSDSDTGMSRSAADQLSLIAGGKEVARIEGDGTSRKLRLSPDGSVGADTGLYFGDGDTGIYESTDDNLAIHIVGGHRYTISSSGIYSVSAFGGYMQRTAGSSIDPIFTFTNDLNTGIGRAAANHLSLIASGKEVARIDGSGNTRQVIINPDGSLGTDTGLLFGDGDTGFYQSIDDRLVLKVNSNTVFTAITGGMVAAGLGTGAPYFVRTAASATVPGFAFYNDADTGIGRAGHNHLSLIGAGKEVARIDGSGNLRKIIVNPDGSTGTDTGVWFGDGDSGIYEWADDTLYLDIADTAKYYFTATDWGSVTSTGARNKQSGVSATVPTVTPRANDADTGIGSAGADQLSLVAGGVEAARFEPSQVTIDGSLNVNGNVTGTTEVLMLTVGDETTDLVADVSVYTFRMPYDMTLTKVKASVSTAPTGTAIEVDVNKAGSSIFSTILSIDISEKTTATASTPAVISDSNLSDDDEMSIDIDQIGSTAPGTGLKVYLIGTKE